MEEELYRALVYHRHGDLLQQIEKAALEGRISKCFLSLAYAVFGKVREAEETMRSLNLASQTLYCLEAKMLIASAHRDRLGARILALQILAENPHAAFARYFLARDALSSKTLYHSIEHYQILLENYPGHDEILLGMAEVLTYARKYSEAMKYVKRANPTLRQRLYVLLISVLRYGSILLFSAIFLFLSAIYLFSGLDIYIWGTVSVSLAMVLFLILREKKDNFISTAFVYIGFIITIAWLLSRWIWSLQGN